jgi:hypothetical protein
MKSSVARAMAKEAFLLTWRRVGSAAMIFWTRATGGVLVEGVRCGKRRQWRVMYSVRNA